MKRLVVAHAARQDLAEIAHHTETQWGTGVSCRSLLAGRHVIYYRETADAVEVVRVLHASMDAQRHIDPDA